jgi:uncharacterized membrane protein YjjP (DUF1212 family)
LDWEKKTAKLSDIAFRLFSLWWVPFAAVLVAPELFPYSGIVIMGIVTAIFIVVGYAYYYSSKPKRTAVPFQPVTSAQTARKRTVWVILTGLEVFDAILAFSIAILDLQIIVTNGVITGLAFNKVNLLLGVLFVCGVIFAVDAGKRFTKIRKKSDSVTY